MSHKPVQQPDKFPDLATYGEELVQHAKQRVAECRVTGMQSETSTMTPIRQLAQTDDGAYQAELSILGARLRVRQVSTSEGLRLAAELRSRFGKPTQG